MWFVVTFGSPRSLNIARLRSRMRSRVFGLSAAAAIGDPGASGAELLHEVDVLLLRVGLARALELRPRVVLRGADEIEEAGLLALHVALGALLVEGVELQHRVVVGTLRQLVDVLRGLLELRLQVGLRHRFIPVADAGLVARTESRGQRENGGVDSRTARGYRSLRVRAASGART